MKPTISKFSPLSSKAPALKIQPRIPGGRIGVVVTLIVAGLMLVDYFLETKFIPAQVLEVDAPSNRILTDKAAFLAEYTKLSNDLMEVGDVIVLELSPISNTVVAYQPQDSLYVYNPRDSIFDYWFVAAGAFLISIYLLIRWNSTQYRFELLMVNLILLSILGLLYFVSS
jgi:hypothetical protein